MGTHVGGFFADLNLITNESSFRKGTAKLHDVGDKIKKFSSFALKSFTLGGGGALGFAAAIAYADTKTTLLAGALRMSSNSLVQYKMAASMAGVKSDELISSLASLEKKSQRLKLGEIDLGMAKSLGMMGIQYQSFMSQNSGDKMKTAMSAALGMGDKGLARELISDVLGDAGKEMFEYLEASGISLQSLLDKSKELLFTNTQTRKNSMIFNQELHTTMGGLKEIGTLFGSTFAGEFTPVLRDLQQLIIKNKELIKTNVVKYAKELAKIGGSVFHVLEKGIPIVSGLITRLGGIEGVMKKVGLGFAIFEGTKLISGLYSLIKGVGILNALKIGGVFLAFAALYYIIEDIAYYMNHPGSTKSFTAMFIKWLDDVGEHLGPLQTLADLLKALMGTWTEKDIMKLPEGERKNKIIEQQAYKKAYKEESKDIKKGIELNPFKAFKRSMSILEADKEAKKKSKETLENYLSTGKMSLPSADITEAENLHIKILLISISTRIKIR